MEQQCKDHAGRIVDIEKRQQAMEIKLTKIEGTTDYIKGRMDNGLSSTITKIYDKLNGICPVVKDNQDIVGRVKAFAFWVTTIGIGGGLIGVIFHLFKMNLENGGA